MKCKDCDKWYGAEDDDYGPCSLKHARGDKKFITHGLHECDEVGNFEDKDGKSRRL